MSFFVSVAEKNNCCNELVYISSVLVLMICSLKDVLRELVIHSLLATQESFLACKQLSLSTIIDILWLCKL